ncbi:hypothetical protein [Clostridium baratii]|uniref:hypothetical protein n=1 Tax=Clostridium baratii TaxID=1561 RepID=UPI003D33CFE2
MRKIMITGLILGSIFMVGCSDVKEEVGNKNNIEQSQEVKEEAEKDVKKIERGTSEAVDEIYYVAKNKGTATSEELKTAYEWIKSNTTNILKGQDNMEKAMYYGNILEMYSKDAEIKKLGQNTIQMVKYVYRGAETALSDSVQKNLRQIKNSIKKIENAK